MRKLCYYLLPVCGMLQVLIIQSQAVRRALYGEPCSREHRCDTRMSLRCNNGSCECLNQEQRFFDEKLQKCLVLAGEHCNYGYGSQSSSRLQDKLECVANSSCSVENICECDNDFFETSKGLCAPKKEHGELCNSDIECHTIKHLQCLKGKCSCDPSEAAFNQLKKKCKAKVGRSCEKYGGCVMNAVCPGENLCQCQSGFTKSSDGLCKGDYGALCDPRQSPCHEKWMCLDGTCSCHFPQHQSFYNITRECVSKVNGPCYEQIGKKRYKFRCELHSECRKGDHGLPECVCKQGYIKSLNGHCKKSHGSECLRDEDCDYIPDSPLRCKEGKCSCPDLNFYDSGVEKCRGLVGAHCNTSKSSFCLDDGFCKPHRHSSGKDSVGRCQCIPPKKSTDQKLCVADQEQGHQEVTQVPWPIYTIDHTTFLSIPEVKKQEQPQEIAKEKNSDLKNEVNEGAHPWETEKELFTDHDNHTSIDGKFILILNNDENAGLSWEHSMETFNEKRKQKTNKKSFKQALSWEDSDEEEKRRIEAQEEERLRVEAQEKARLRLEAEEKERLRLEAQEKERLRLEAEEKERKRLEAEEKERLRLEVQEKERLRLEAQEKERIRLEAEEKERLRLEAQEKEMLRLEAEKKERLRLEAQEKERLRLEAEEKAAKKVDNKNTSDSGEYLLSWEESEERNPAVNVENEVPNKSSWLKTNGGFESTTVKIQSNMNDLDELSWEVESKSNDIGNEQNNKNLLNEEALDTGRDDYAHVPLDKNLQNDFTGLAAQQKSDSQSQSFGMSNQRLDSDKQVDQNRVNSEFKGGPVLESIKNEERHKDEEFDQGLNSVNESKTNSIKASVTKGDNLSSTEVEALSWEKSQEVEAGHKGQTKTTNQNQKQESIEALSWEKSQEVEAGQKGQTKTTNQHQKSGNIEALSWEDSKEIGNEATTESYQSNFQDYLTVHGKPEMDKDLKNWRENVELNSVKGNDVITSRSEKGAVTEQNYMIQSWARSGENDQDVKPHKLDTGFQGEGDLGGGEVGLWSSMEDIQNLEETKTSNVDPGGDILSWEKSGANGVAEKKEDVVDNESLLSWEISKEDESESISGIKNGDMDALSWEFDIKEKVDPVSGVKKSDMDALSWEIDNKEKIDPISGVKKSDMDALSWEVSMEARKTESSKTPPESGTAGDSKDPDLFSWEESGDYSPKRVNNSMDLSTNVEKSKGFPDKMGVFSNFTEDVSNPTEKFQVTHEEQHDKMNKGYMNNDLESWEENVEMKKYGNVYMNVHEVMSSEKDKFQVVHESQFTGGNNSVLHKEMSSWERNVEMEKNLRRKGHSRQKGTLLKTTEPLIFSEESNEAKEDQDLLSWEKSVEMIKGESNEIKDTSSHLDLLSWEISAEPQDHKEVKALKDTGEPSFSDLDTLSWEKSQEVVRDTNKAGGVPPVTEKYGRSKGSKHDDVLSWEASEEFDKKSTNMADAMNLSGLVMGRSSDGFVFLDPYYTEDESITTDFELFPATTTTTEKQTVSVKSATKKDCIFGDFFDHLDKINNPESTTVLIPETQEDLLEWLTSTTENSVPKNKPKKCIFASFFGGEETPPNVIPKVETTTVFNSICNFLSPDSQNGRKPTTKASYDETTVKTIDSIEENTEAVRNLQTTDKSPAEESVESSTPGLESTTPGLESTTTPFNEMKEMEGSSAEGENYARDQSDKEEEEEKSLDHIDESPDGEDDEQLQTPASESTTKSNKNEYHGTGSSKVENGYDMRDQSERGEEEEKSLDHINESPDEESEDKDATPVMESMTESESNINEFHESSSSSSETGEKDENAKSEQTEEQKSSGNGDPPSFGRSLGDNDMVHPTSTTTTEANDSKMTDTPTIGRSIENGEVTTPFLDISTSTLSITTTESNHPLPGLTTTMETPQGRSVSEDDDNEWEEKKTFASDEQTSTVISELTTDAADSSEDYTLESSAEDDSTTDPSGSASGKSRKNKMGRNFLTFTTESSPHDRSIDEDGTNTPHIDFTTPSSDNASN